MIIGERKPFEEIKESIKNYKSILILGCGTCVSVCMAGGEKEVGLLASQLRMATKLQGNSPEIKEATVQRQCDREYIDSVKAKTQDCDAIISMACGAGVQLTAEVLENLPVIPALNTRFIGITQTEGIWAERCMACGNCVLGRFGGVCPVTMCSKSLLSGPCGGARMGKCEAGNDKDCAWQLIYQRLKKQGRLDNILGSLAPLDNRLQAHPRRVTLE